MRRPGHIALLSAMRVYAPLIVLFALSLFVARAPGGGVGLLAGLTFALALWLHVLVFGAAAARTAAPPGVLRLLLALGLAMAACGAGMPGLPWAGQLIEGGLFAVAAGGTALVIGALTGRAPSLRDEEW